MSKDLTGKELNDEGLTIWGGGINRNRNESEDGHVASTDCRQLIDYETMLVVRTSEDRLIIVRCGSHCGTCGRVVV